MKNIMIFQTTFITRKTAELLFDTILNLKWDFISAHVFSVFMQDDNLIIYKTRNKIITWALKEK